MWLFSSNSLTIDPLTNQEQIRLTAVKGRGWESHLTVVNRIADGRAGDDLRQQL